MIRPTRRWTTRSLAKAGNGHLQYWACYPISSLDCVVVSGNLNWSIEIKVINFNSGNKSLPALVFWVINAIALSSKIKANECVVISKC